MCGIVGYIGNQKASNIIIKGLKRLEYRGYDSAGLSTMENNQIFTSKCKGKITDLESLPSIEEEIKVVTYIAAEGDISTDLLSPGHQAHSRADRELHGQCMITPEAQ